MFWPYADNGFEEMRAIAINKGIEDGRFWAQTQEERQHRPRRGNATQPRFRTMQKKIRCWLCSFRGMRFDKFKDRIAADKRQLETVIKTSTSSLQAEMLAVAQSFTGVMVECDATVAADSKSQIAQAVGQAVKDTDGGVRRNRGDGRCRNDRRNDDQRDDNCGPAELF